MIQIPRFLFLPLLLSGPGIPDILDELQRYFEATFGDSDGCGFCYKSSVFRLPRAHFDLILIYLLDQNSSSVDVQKEKFSKIFSLHTGISD